MLGFVTNTVTKLLGLNSTITIDDEPQVASPIVSQVVGDHDPHTDHKDNQVDQDDEKEQARGLRRACR